MTPNTQPGNGRGMARRSEGEEPRHVGESPSEKGSKQGAGPDADPHEAKAAWTFLTNHAHVLVCIAEEPNIRGRDIATRVGLTERAVQAIIGDLVAAGYILRCREGRRNRYSVNPDGPMRHPLDQGHTVGDLFAAMGHLPHLGLRDSSLSGEDGPP
jgi:hypothetical protein